MIDDADHLPLTELPRELARLTGQRPPTYRRCWNQALDGLLPTDRVNGRHYVRRQNLPAIAILFGLIAPERHGEVTRRKGVAATSSESVVTTPRSRPGCEA